MKKILIIFLLLSSCGKLREPKFLGTWSIHDASIKNYDNTLIFYTNIFSLEEDWTCSLPKVIDSTATDCGSRCEGQWEVIRENDITYLNFTTTNKIFNRKFTVKSIRKIQDMNNGFGYIFNMKLESDSIYLDCYRY